MKKLSQLTRDFNNAKNVYAKMDKDNPRIIGALGVKVMRENFDAQGFVDSVGPARKWKERSQTTNDIYDAGRTVGKNRKEAAKAKKQGNSYKGTVYSSKNPILVQSGNLKAGLSYRSNTPKGVNIGVNLNTVPYAKLMNEGGLVQFNGKWVRIPARKYLGMSQKLKVRITSELKKRRTQALSKFKIST